MPFLSSFGRRFQLSPAPVGQTPKHLHDSPQPHQIRFGRRTWWLVLWRDGSASFGIASAHFTTCFPLFLLGWLTSWGVMHIESWGALRWSFSPPHTHTLFLIWYDSGSPRTGNEASRHGRLHALSPWPPWQFLRTFGVVSFTCVLHTAIMMNTLCPVCPM